MAIILIIVGFTVTDIAPNPIKAKGIYTVEECKIKMQSEVVKVDLFHDSSIVDCSFEMINKGEVTALEVGFPVMNFHYWSGSSYYGGAEKEKFEIYVDGKLLTAENIKVPKTIEPLYNQLMDGIKLSRHLHNKYLEIKDSIYTVHGIYENKRGTHYPNDFVRKTTNQFLQSKRQKNYNRTAFINQLSQELDDKVRDGEYPWYVWDMTFEKGEKKMITVKYSLPSGTGYGGKYRYFNYLLNTGAGWYDDIGKADVILKLHDIEMDKIEKIHPQEFQIDEASKTIHWTFHNLEPTTDDDVYVQYYKPSERRKFKQYSRRKGIGLWLNRTFNRK